MKAEISKTEQPHKYKDGDKTEIIELGFFKRGEEITIKQIPFYVKKVPKNLPSQIKSLFHAFAFRYERHGKVEGFENWDTKNIENMSYVFYENHTINDDISKWDTSNVTNMQGMFKNAIKFNNGDKPLNWKTEKVENMESMFDGAESFKQSLKNWKVEKVNKNKNFSRSSGIFGVQSKNPSWKIPEEDDPITKKPEPKQPEVIIHPSPTPRPKVTIPLTKIITPATKSNSSPKTTPKPNSGLVNPKSTMTQSNQSSKKLSTPAIVGIVVGTQAVLTSLGFGIPYIIKRFKK
nr:BspA family leucine-rich repeat surface protein [Mycoplasma feriruminatoris]